MGCRFVTPAIVRLPLSDGDFIDVKQELNAGEYADFLMDMAERKPFAKILAYVTGWSFVGPDGPVVPYSLQMPEESRRDTVRSLSPRTVRELIATLDRHEQAAEAAYLAKKNGSATQSASSPTSESVAP